MTPEIALLYRTLAKRVSLTWKQKIKPHQLIGRALIRYYNRKMAILDYKDWRDKIFDEIYERDCRRCYWCPTQLTKKEATLDHLTPPGRGGSPTSLDNVVICCPKCNNDKGYLTEEEYRYKLAVKENART